MQPVEIVRKIRAARPDCEAALNTYCSPEETDRRCKGRQAELLAAFGGREKALAMGDLGYTPAPGTRPEFNN